MSSKQAVETIKEIYRISANRVPTEVTIRQNKELEYAYKAITDNAWRNQLTNDQREFVAGRISLI